ncbi:MAG: glucokinase [Desulfovibrio sp.]|uniref:glucokinase n=1 Tax=Desulfovibrio sp. 7SRBS1 TaxID=3378064 RepID=UPI003B41BDCF
MKILAGDIGGTNTRLAVYTTEERLSPVTPIKKYTNRQFKGLDEIIAEFLDGSPHADHLEKACFDVAGPIIDNRVDATNLPWSIRASELVEALGGLPVTLLNDLEAMAYAVPHLSQDDLQEINPGKPQDKAPKAIVAPGTGLGEAYLTWGGSCYQAHSSEGGHTDFGPRTDTEMELLAYLRKTLHRVSYERVCSGMGTPNLFNFLRDTGRYPVPEALQAELDANPDMTAVILGNGMKNPDKYPICKAVLDLFVAILGSEAGNLALKLGPHGGLYVGGGIPLHIAEAVHSAAFMEAFLDKGRLSPMVKEIPVYLITNSDPALTGSAAHALEL